MWLAFKRSFLMLLLLGGLAEAQPAATLVSEEALAAVPVTRVVRPGASVPGTPEELNASITIRYGVVKPRVVLILMPGFLGGAGSLDRLARQVVALDPQVAVWAVDRRSNLLEPQDVIAQASPAELERIVREGLPVRNPASVSFMQNWGLDTTLRDWRVAVLEARELTRNVVIGGHSLGGVLAGTYAAYDFGGQAGYRDVRGLVLLDGLPGLSGVSGLSEREYREGSWSLAGHQSGVEDLARTPFTDSVVFGPKLASRAAAQARLTALNPSGLAPRGGLSSFPATNLASGASRVAGRYALLPFLSMNLGRASNAVEAPNPLGAVLGQPVARWVLGPREKNLPVGWLSDEQAVTDALDFTQRFWNPVSDYVEWYFPSRLTLDLAAVGLDSRGTPFQQELPVWHLHQMTTPILGIAAQQGLTTENDYRTYVSRTYGALTTHTLPGAAHLDITAARSDQVARWVVGWLASIAR